MPDFHHLHIGPRLTLSFQRTLRIPDDGRSYPLPPGLGAFPIYRARPFPDAPAAWRQADDLFISMYEREALWIGMHGAAWHPDAVMVGLGNINAVSGHAWQLALSDSPANYLVCPPQPWLDGINAGEGQIRQFVAMPVGSTYTVENQINKNEEAGGLRIAVFQAKLGKFPEEEPPKPNILERMRMGSPMGIAVGGTMNQKIYPDPYGLSTWNPEPMAVLRVHILNSSYFQAVTKLSAAPTPVDAKTYTDAGLPWFELYDNNRKSLPLPKEFAQVQSIANLDNSEQQQPINVPKKQIWLLR